MQLAFFLLRQYFDSERKEGKGSKGTLPCKVFFHVLQSECHLSLNIHEMESEATVRVQSVRTG